MSPGRSHPSIVMDVQVLVTHADRVTMMEREMGHPPRIIRGPDLCYLFQARDEARLPGLVDRWESYGIAVQVVQIVPDGGPSSGPEPAGRDPSPRVMGPDPRDRSTHGAPHTRRDSMDSTTDHGHKGHRQPVHPPTDARGPEGPLDVTPEMEAACEEIER